MNSHYFLLEVFFPPGIRIYHIYQASPSTVSMKLHDFDFHIQFKFFTSCGMILDKGKKEVKIVQSI